MNGELLFESPALKLANNHNLPLSGEVLVCIAAAVNKHRKDSHFVSISTYLISSEA